MNSPEPIIRLEGLEKRYLLGGEVEVRALRGVDLVVPPGSYLAIMGPSGSGKSTMLNLLGCLDRPTAGRYFLGGTDVSCMPDDELSEARGRRIGFIFQSYNLIAQLTVIENIQVPLFYQGKDVRTYEDHCAKLAQMVGLGDRLNHRPNQLSGGQQQRVAIARSLVNDPLMILADEPTGNLDSRTGQEVLELIDNLNAQGKTIILVTHDERIATRAHRVIHMRDGLIERELLNRREPNTDVEPVEHSMNLFSFQFLSTVRLGVKSLALHKLRSVLTMLGIIFGVCSVIAMLAIGEGASYEAQEAIKKLGSQNIIIRSLKPPEDTKQSGLGRGMLLEYGLTYDDGARIQSTIPGIVRVLPVRIIRENALFAQNNVPCQVIGTLPFYPEIVGLDIVRGRFLSDMDERNHYNVCVLTVGLAQRLFPYQDPLQQSVKVDAFYYQVVGLVREKNMPEQRTQTSKMEGEPLDNNLYIPLSTSRSRFGDVLVRRTAGSMEVEKVELHQVTMQMRDVSAVESADPQVKTLLNHFHNKNDYEIIVPLQLLRQAEQTKRIFNIVLGSIAAISLLVGGIGIMNIMLATVTERTREIGVRRALGAKRRDITMQFLVETVVLAVGGGLIGVIVGIITPLVVSQLTTMKTIVTFWSVLLAFCISGAVGIIFGLYPAKAAARLDPIDALRHE